MTLKQFNDYDILLVLPSKDDDNDNNNNNDNDSNQKENNKEEAEAPIQFATSNHVGNNRFTILLNLHRENFESALRNNDNDNDKCMDIIQTLVDTVCHQCVPNGRFLEQKIVKNGKDEEGCCEYRDLGDGKEAMEVVRKALSQPCIPVAKQHQHQQPKEEVWTDNDDVAPLSSNGDGDESIDSAAIDGFMANYFVSLMSSNHDSNKNNDNDDTNEKKRRRKSSLLRRSVTDVGIKLNQSKSKCKRSFRRISSLFRPGIRHSQVTNYDVLCAYEQDDNGVHAILSSSTATPTANPIHVGNTRFAIMTDLRRAKYEQDVSSHNFTERSNIVNDIVKTVHQTCSGRFLIQDDHTKLYHPMSTESAMASVEAWLLNSTSSSSSSSLTMTKTTNSVSDIAPPMLISSSSAPPLLLTKTQRQPSDDSITLSSKSSRSTNSLPTPPPTVNRRSSEVSKLRSAAIQSLLRKKQMKEVVDRHRQKSFQKNDGRTTTTKNNNLMEKFVVSVNIPTPGSIPSHLNNNSIHSIKSNASH